MWSKASRALLGALAFLATATITTPADACSCVRYETAASHVRNTDLIVRARAIRTIPNPTVEYGEITTFFVVEMLKGRTPSVIRIRHPRAVCCMCGLTFTPGEIRLVFVHREGAAYTTSACSDQRFSEEEYRAALAAGPVYR